MDILGINSENQKTTAYEDDFIAILKCIFDVVTTPMVLQLITFLNHLISLIGLFTLHNWCGYLKSFLKSKSRLTIPEFYGSYCNQFVLGIFSKEFFKGRLIKWRLTKFKG